jgi:DNA-binding response OmpR family regulator
MNSETDVPEYVILIVDDNPTNLSVIASYLDEYNFEIITAGDGEGGLERARLVQPDLILLDVLLSGIDGFEVCRRLKADQATRDIPVIFMTVLTGAKHRRKGFQVGAVDYITKPFQKEEVLARIANLRLQELAARLEQTVQERTRELTAANQQLHRLNNELTHEIAERRRAEEELKKHHEQLEEIVAQRTAELRRIINVMAGRELRMAELKKVIRKLRAQLKEAGLTPVANDPLLADGKNSPSTQGNASTQVNDRL